MSLPNQLNDREYQAFRDSGSAGTNKAVSVEQAANAPIPVTYGAATSRQIIPLQKKLLNAGSALMNVNGSVTPVTFSHSFAQTSYLTGMHLVIKDAGNANPNNFGTLTALTNGVLIRLIIGGINYDLFTMNVNIDLAHFFSEGNGVPGSPNGWFNDNDCYFGSKFFKAPIKMALNDSVNVIIQDDLSTIDNFRMGLSAYYEI